MEEETIFPTEHVSSKRMKAVPDADLRSNGPTLAKPLKKSFASRQAQINQSLRDKKRTEALMSDEACRAREKRRLLIDLPTLFDQVWTHMSLRKVQSLPMNALARELSERSPGQKLHDTIAGEGLRLIADIVPEFCRITKLATKADGHSQVERFTLKTTGGIANLKSISLDLKRTTRIKDVREQLVIRAKTMLDEFVQDPKYKDLLQTDVDDIQNGSE